MKIIYKPFGESVIKLNNFRFSLDLLDIPVTQTLIGPYRDIDFRCENVVANPPFETTAVVDFLSWLAKVQQPGDRSVLLLPHGFIDKQRPKSIQETLRQFEVLYRTPMQERFARTNVTAEIVVLERR